MAWISSTTAVYAHCCTLFTFAFLLGRDASVLATHSFVTIVGQAMMLKPSTISSASDTTQLLIVLISLLGLTDFVQLTFKNVKYFESIIPTRLTLSFILCGWSYFFSNSLLHNDLAFVFLFLEMWFHFLLYNVVRQEKHDRNKKFEEKLEQEILTAQQGGVDMEELAKKLARTSDL